MDPVEIEIETGNMNLHYFEEQGVYRINGYYYFDEEVGSENPNKLLDKIKGLRYGGF